MGASVVSAGVAATRRGSELVRRAARENDESRSGSDGFADDQIIVPAANRISAATAMPELRLERMRGFMETFLLGGLLKIQLVAAWNTKGV
jgi:hypothetical protein